jgi:phosphoglycolate phosphatase-like HAD superfamily hydrolase
MTKLILFDIDGTLVSTGGAGGRAMARAASDVFALPDADKSIAMAGRTDVWIVAQMAARHGALLDESVLARFEDAYIGYLREEIDRPGTGGKGVLPGVTAILDMLSRHDGAHLALLTGNFRRGAQIKLEYFGIWQYFESGAFGEDAQNRNHLLQIAIDRVTKAGGPVVPPSDVVVVGDTPLDGAVALAGGAKALGVATGPYDAARLRASGAHVVLEDLRDEEAVLRALELISGPD